VAAQVTEIWRVDAERPEAGLIAKAAAILRAGGLVAFPTETVYGLGANALDAAAVGRIYQAKGRPARNPVIVHVAAVADAQLLASAWGSRATALAERFWPGPLTLVLPRSARVPDLVTAGGPNVALRCPAHPVALALLRAAGVPIAAPSANRSSELSPTLAEHVWRGLHGRIDAILDGGPTRAGIESTVLDLSGPIPRLLRPGPIPPAELERLLGPIERHSCTVGPGTEPLPAPGLLARHYSPHTTLECLPTSEQTRARAEELSGKGMRLGVVATRALGLRAPAQEVILPENAERYAAQLYIALHRLDDGALDRILVCLPPDTEEWLAIRDRLLRAASCVNGS
jgi:L-threonylcarbamoyladenylate synthase